MGADPLALPPSLYIYCIMHYTPLFALIAFPHSHFIFPANCRPGTGMRNQLRTCPTFLVVLYIHKVL